MHEFLLLFFLGTSRNYQHMIEDMLTWEATMDQALMRMRLDTSSSWGLCTVAPVITEGL